MLTMICASIIPQRYSWGELQVTADIFKRMLIHLNASESLLNIVIEFGSRVRHELPRGNTTFFTGRAHSRGTVDKGESHEASYIIQYVERNGRNRGDPWSLRQTGVYSQTQHSTHQTTWILLQLSKSIRSLLEIELSRIISHRTRDSDYLALHALLLRATVDNWGDYVQDLSSQVRSLEEKARSAILSTQTTQYHGSGIKDLQTLQRIEQKISIASSALKSNTEVAAGLIDQWECFAASTVSACCEKARGTVLSYTADIQVHQESLKTLLNLLHRIDTLFSQIIEVQNVNRLQSVTEMSSRQLDSLNSLIKDIRDESRNSSTLVAHTHSDTKSMKALTTVATALLPASLIATIFSSNLIQLEQSNEGVGHGTHFVVASQFWVYILVSIAMTGTTLGCIRLLEYWWARRSP
ncbi:hypothetical protein FB567DRAFT_531627 [Paraphoma chrysanthemicola]|uniref:CorA-like transporter domain-containing protein n=1 Tax=Paraphoma chrysanthemicola TaxID=798071 RepID=A0A8K0R067_9PLEO|nr:hypothetical protein FB567DRAFT_531627 [Paraphoma chrysanthemicola]